MKHAEAISRALGAVHQLEPALTPTQRRVLAYLLELIRPDAGARCCPTRAEIAEACGTTWQTVRQVLKALEERDLLRREPVPGRPNWIRVNLAKLAGTWRPVGKDGRLVEPRGENVIPFPPRW